MGCPTKNMYKYYFYEYKLISQCYFSLHYNKVDKIANAVKRFKIGRGTRKYSFVLKNGGRGTIII